MDIKQFINKQVRIIDVDNERFEGFVSDYIFAEDNEPEEEAIVIETPEGLSIEFRVSEINEINDIAE